MQFGAVAFVLAETIFGKTATEVTHHRVAGHFCDYAGGGDGETVAIAVDDCRSARAPFTHVAPDEPFRGIEAQWEVIRRTQIR